MSSESPCVKICRLDPAGRVCLGCFRSLDEIALWSGMTAEQRRQANARADRRRLERAADGRV
jgi:predicted Fe-S protein YdhL (DUF1289 family)